MQRAAVLMRFVGGVLESWRDAPKPVECRYSYQASLQLDVSRLAGVQLVPPVPAELRGLLFVVRVRCCVGVAVLVFGLPRALSTSEGSQMFQPAVALCVCCLTACSSAEC